jgi:hypothetical protein
VSYERCPATKAPSFLGFIRYLEPVPKSGKRIRTGPERIAAAGKQITLWVNGAVTSELKECDVPRGFIGLEAEGYRVEYRNVQVKAMK